MLRTERQSARMSKIKNGGLDQYGAEPFEQQQFGTAGVEGVNSPLAVAEPRRVWTGVCWSSPARCSMYLRQVLHTSSCRCPDQPAGLHRPTFSMPVIQCTLCLKTVPTFKLSVTLSTLNGFSKLLHWWKAYEMRYKPHTTLPTSR